MTSQIPSCIKCNKKFFNSTSLPFFQICGEVWIEIKIYEKYNPLGHYSQTCPGAPGDFVPKMQKGKQKKWPLLTGGRFHRVCNPNQTGGGGGGGSTPLDVLCKNFRAPRFCNFSFESCATCNAIFEKIGRTVLKLRNVMLQSSVCSKYGNFLDLCTKHYENGFMC